MAEPVDDKDAKLEDTEDSVDLAVTLEEGVSDDTEELEVAGELLDIADEVAVVECALELEPVPVADGMALKVNEAGGVVEPDSEEAADGDVFAEGEALAVAEPEDVGEVAEDREAVAVSMLLREPEDV